MIFKVILGIRIFIRSLKCISYNFYTSKRKNLMSNLTIHFYKKLNMIDSFRKENIFSAKFLSESD